MGTCGYKRRIAAFTIGWLAAGCSCAQARGGEWHVVSADSEWTWGEDYAFAYATYAIACEPNRSCGVGTGVSVNHHPLGSKTTIHGVDTVTVVGIGSIHFRAADGKGPVQVQFVLTDRALATLPPLTW
jgi:hypothetical protein